MGRPKKVVEVPKETKATVAKTLPTDESVREVTPLKDVVHAPAAPDRSALNEKLGEGQAFFEAPDGTIVIGEADRGKILYRPKNGGAPMWINPRR